MNCGYPTGPEVVKGLRKLQDDIVKEITVAPLGEPDESNQKIPTKVIDPISEPSTLTIFKLSL